MTKEGVYLQFDGPAGWAEFREGVRIVFQGRNREELIISGTFIVGEGDAAEERAIQEKLVKGAIEIAERSALHPDLKVALPFAPDPRVTGFECWTILAETRQGDTVFYQSVIGHLRGVLFVTFESPKSADTDRTYDQFLRSIRHS